MKKMMTPRISTNTHQLFCFSSNSFNYFNSCNSWAKNIKNNEKPAAPKIARSPQILTQIICNGYPMPHGKVKGILRHLKGQNTENGINRPFRGLMVLGDLRRFKRVLRRLKMKLNVFFQNLQKIGFVSNAKKGVLKKWPTNYTNLHEN